MDYKAFAASIKTKYPQYAQVDDKVLAQKMVDKYPVYANQVEFNDAQPKSILSDAFENIVQGAGNMAGGILDTAKTAYQSFSPIPSQNPLVQSVIGTGKEAVQGTLPRDILNTGKAMFEPTAQRLVDATQGQVVPLATKGFGGIPQAVQNIPHSMGQVARKPFDYAMDASMVAGAAGAANPEGTMAKIGGWTNPIGAPIAAAGKLMGAIPSKIAPFASQIDQQAVDSAGRLGIKLPASAASKSPVVSNIETAAGRGLFGGDIVAQVESSNNALAAAADTLVETAKGSPDLSVAGNHLNQAMDSYKNLYLNNRTALYEAFDKAEGGQISATVKHTKAALDEILGRTGKTFGTTSRDSAMFKALSDDIEKFGEPSFENLKLTRTRLMSLQNSGGVVNTGNTANVGAVIKALTEDMDSSIKAMQKTIPNGFDYGKAIDTADAYYADGLKRLNNNLVKSVVKFVDQNQPERVVPYVLSKSVTAEQLDDLFKVLPPKTADTLQASVLQKMFDASRNPQTGIFTPAGLARQVQTIGIDKLSKILTPEQIKFIDDAGNVANALGRSGRIAAGGSALIGRLMAELGTVLISPMLAVKLIGGDALATKFIASPEGQALLTKGVGMQGVKKFGKGMVDYAPNTAIPAAAVNQQGQQAPQQGQMFNGEQVTNVQRVQ